MELPDLEGRKAIFRVHLKDVKHSDIDLDAVGRATAGSSGADIANIVNEAALRAVRLGEKAVTTTDIEESVEAGYRRRAEERSRHLTGREAYHQLP